VTHEGWDGEMDGPMRGRRLVRCEAHRGIWFRAGDGCPVCTRDQTIQQLERRVQELERAARPREG
jgi:hypothetical protein